MARRKSLNIKPRGSDSGTSRTRGESRRRRQSSLPADIGPFGDPFDIPKLQRVLLDVKKRSAEAANLCDACLRCILQERLTREKIIAHDAEMQRFKREVARIARDASALYRLQSKTPLSEEGKQAVLNECAWLQTFVKRGKEIIARHEANKRSIRFPEWRRRAVRLIVSTLIPVYPPTR